MNILVPIPLEDPEMIAAMLPSVRRLGELIPGAKIHLLTVLDPREARGVRSSTAVPTPPFPASTTGPIITAPSPAMVESHGEAQERAHAEADEALQALAAAELPASSPVTQIAWSRHPAERIVKAARELNADVIVMATHSRTGMAHLLDGSVAEAVVHEAPVPVLLIGPGCDRG